MALTTIKTGAISDDAVTEDKIANAINTARAANTAKDLTALSASNLTSGTVPDARFPATLPAASAANLTAVPAANITGTLPAISAANLTNVPAANITGTLPAISGANLTNLPASGKATNLIINGAMNVAQRSTSAVTTDGYGSVDRYQVTFSGHDEAITHQQADVTSGTTPYTLGFRKALKITNGNQTSGAGAGDFAIIYQPIEAQNMAQSGWNHTSSSSYVTLSFWCKSSVAQSFAIQFKSSDGTAQNYPMETGSLTADTWTKITKTIPGGSNVAFDNNNGTGLEFMIWLFGGTNYSDSGVTFNQWGAYSSSARFTDMTSTWWTTNDATFELTGVQLEVSESASDFAHESYADTLLKCYRYYYAHTGMLWGITSAGDHLDLNFTYPIPMRTTPSRTQVDTSLEFKNRLNQDNSTSASTSSYSGAISPTGDFWIARPGSGDSWGTNYASDSTRAVYWHAYEGTTSYSWDAELQ